MHYMIWIHLINIYIIMSIRSKYIQDSVYLFNMFTKIMQLLQGNNCRKSKTWCLERGGQDKNGWRWRGRGRGWMTLHNTLLWIIPAWNDDVPYTTSNCRLVHKTCICMLRTQETKKRWPLFYSLPVGFEAS